MFIEEFGHSPAAIRYTTWWLCEQYTVKNFGQKHNNVYDSQNSLLVTDKFRDDGHVNSKTARKPRERMRKPEQPPNTKVSTPLGTTKVETPGKWRLTDTRSSSPPLATNTGNQMEQENGSDPSPQMCIFGSG